MTKPNKLPERGLDPEARRVINQLIDFAASKTVLSHSDVEIDRTAQGVFIRPKNSGDNNSSNTAPRWG